MHQHISILTQRGLVTIPMEIREKLGLQAGDKIEFEMEEGQVVLKKLIPFDLGYHRALESQFSEWNSKEDDEAYKDL